MRDIDKFFERRPAGTLYHYTNVGSVVGIAKSRVIYASSAQYLNDSSELTFGMDLLAMAINRQADASNDSDERVFLDDLTGWLKLYRNIPYPIFICSLSEHGSLLSQWRSYTSHGKGVSLGFSPGMISRTLALSGCQVAKCIYDPEEQSAIVEELLSLLLTSFRNEKPERQPIGPPDKMLYYGYIDGFRFDLFRVLAIIKDKSFEEESEWRIIYTPESKSTPLSILYREGASMLVPYVELPLGSDQQGCIFSKACLGPSRHTSLSIFALQDFLRQCGAVYEAHGCLIPYREW